LLELAKRITYWGMGQDYEDKYVVDFYNELNLFQILKREGNLSQANKKRIKEMIVDFADDNLLLTGAYILLENYDMALEKYSLLCDDDKEHLNQLPIMHLWNSKPKFYKSVPAYPNWKKPYHGRMILPYPVK